MDYYDGTSEQFILFHEGWDRTKKIICAYSSGSSLGNYIWRYVRNTLSFFAFLMIILVLAVSPLILEDPYSGLIFTSFIFLFLFFFIAVPILLAVLVFSLYQGKKLLSNTKTVLTGDSIEIDYLGNPRFPVQKTIIPYDNISGIRDISDQEWKEDLGMGNFFRRAFNMPMRRTFGRFQLGSTKNTILSIDLLSPISARKFKMTTGSMGILGGILISPFLGLFHQNVIEENEVTKRIFLSIPANKTGEIKIKIKYQKDSYSKMNDHSKKFEDPNVAEVDPSSFMNLIYGNRQT